MMPSSLGAGRMQFVEGAYPSSNGAAEHVDALAGRAEALWHRVTEIEGAVSVREWWLLGRAVPEARLLSEVSSLLAVARGELENAMVQGFGHSVPRADTTEQFTAYGHDDIGQTSDPAWISACREQAVGLLRMIAASLPPMFQYAQMLHSYGEQLGLATPAVDSLGIVADRLNEIGEALRLPPQQV
ncbi:MAG: hypothetical protein ACLQUY_13915 [Ktedonobacterales bacterium]